MNTLKDNLQHVAMIEPMTAEHTSGPWEAFGPLKFTVYGGDPKRRVAVVDYIQGQSSEESDANARLIAAAPDMLATLETIADFAVGNGDVCELIAKRARAAIAKATQ